MSPQGQIIPPQRIEKSIFLIRGHKVMRDADLAELYQVSAKVLNQAVKRNDDRFPADLMFRLTAEEFTALRSQIVSFQCSTKQAIRQLMTPPEPKKRKIGFLVEERAARYGKR